MAVAFDAASESHTGTSGNTGSPDPFTWTHTPSGTPRGVAIFVFTASGTDQLTGVTYGGVTAPQIAAATALDSATEPGRTELCFLGASVPTGPQTVSVDRTGTNTMYAIAVSVTAGADTEVHEAGIVLVQDDGTLVEQSVTDGSPGTDSLRLAGTGFGSNDVPAAGANSTAVHSLDIGARTFAVVRETTAGQGSRSVGFNTGATSDDRHATHFAIRESGPTEHERAAAISAAGDLVIAGQRDLLRQVAISAASDLVIVGQRDLLRQAAISAVGDVAISGVVVPPPVERSVEISATGGIAIAGQRDLLRQVAIAANASISISGVVVGQEGTSGPRLLLGVGT